MVCDEENEINHLGRKFAKIGVNGDDEKADGPDYGGYCGLFASFKAFLQKEGRSEIASVTLTGVTETGVPELVLVSV